MHKLKAAWAIFLMLLIRSLESCWSASTVNHSKILSNVSDRPLKVYKVRGVDRTPVFLHFRKSVHHSPVLRSI